MKIVEPISSALLITGCVYAAGISQNSAFMREFGVNPEFSQPPVDKILYDGGLITFEIFYNHLKLAALVVALLIAVFVVVWIVTKFFSGNAGLLGLSGCISGIKKVASYAPVGLLLLLYIIYLCFASYQKSQDVGVKLSETFMDRCHWVVLKDKESTTKACAFRKDKDSIWYYNIKGSEININSKLLTEVGQVTYLEPEKRAATPGAANK